MRPAVAVEIYKERGANLVDVGRLALAEVQRIGKDPDMQGIEIYFMQDQTEGVTSSLNELADAVHPFLVAPHPAEELKAQDLTETARMALTTLRDKLAALTDWQAAALAQAIKESAAAHGLKMPQVAIPLRVVLLGQPQSPSIDAVLAVLGRARVLARLVRQIGA